MNRKTTDILDENSQRTTGKNALFSNIDAARAVAEIVKTTLGPMGMDKMLIDNLGNTIITNDGVKILKEMEIEHPGAKILVDVAKTQEAVVGDGTTTAVILTGELLNNAKNLLEKKIHPTNIVRGYKKASEKAYEILEKNSIEIDINNKKVIKDISMTAMMGKVAEGSKEKLSEIIYSATNQVKDILGIPKDKIKIVKSTGGDIDDSYIVKGIVLDKDTANPNMPQSIENARILLIDFPLEIRELESEAKVNINSLEEYEAFSKSEDEYLKNLVIKIRETGANTVICQKGIDDAISYYLAKEGIMATRRTRRSDMEKLSFALGKNIVSSIDDILSNNLGIAKHVFKKEIQKENYIFIEGCINPKAITLFLKASTNQVLDEVERAVEDAIGDINAVLNSKRIVAGGSAIEIELYKELSKFAKKQSGKEQLIIEAFAKSFLIVPRVLCENCGLDEIETMAQLIANHEKGLDKSGIDSFSGICEDTMRKAIVEPINIKLQAIKSATEASSMILRIDDIIAAKKLDIGKNSYNEDF